MSKDDVIAAQLAQSTANWGSRYFLPPIYGSAPKRDPHRFSAKPLVGGSRFGADPAALAGAG
jgi:hypothetical protein